jgi:hypothetical protein
MTAEQHRTPALTSAQQGTHTPALAAHVEHTTATRIRHGTRYALAALLLLAHAGQTAA